MKKCISIAQWLQLDADIRRQLVLHFGIPKTGIPETYNGKVTCDGVTQKDLFSLDIPKMMEYLRDILPFYREDLCDFLFSLLLKKFLGEPIDTFEPKEIQEEVNVPSEAKRGRPKKINLNPELISV